MRRLWLFVGSLAALAAVLFAAFNVLMLLAHEEVTEQHRFEAAGIASILVHADNGTVEVTGGDVDEIAVSAEISHGLRRTSHRAEVEGDRLVVRGDCHMAMSYWCRTTYRVTVPADLPVVAEANNGRITLRDLRGDVDADSHNGRIELIRMAGDVTAESRNGRVEATGLRSGRVDARTSNGSVTLTFAAAPTTVEAHSRNGSVEVVVPDGPIAYRVVTDTSFGSVDAAVRTDPQGERSITATTRNGSVRVRYPTG